MFDGDQVPAFWPNTVLGAGNPGTIKQNKILALMEPTA